MILSLTFKKFLSGWSEWHYLGLIWDHRFYYHHVCITLINCFCTLVNSKWENLHTVPSVVPAKRLIADGKFPSLLLFQAFQLPENIPLH